MSKNEFDSEDSGLDRTTPAERTEVFKALLDELDEKTTELAKRLRGLGDYRSVPTILRGIQRMSAGDTAVSGEMLAIVRMLVNQQRLRYHRHRDVDWKPQLKGGGWFATIEGFKVILSPQTKHRWKIHLSYGETGYSPEWQAWQQSLEAAKRKALTCVADGLLEVCDLDAGRL
jgi:hypothetical protein